MSDIVDKKNLFRIPEKGKIFGVCAGIAEYWGWETWKIRLITLIAALFSGFWLVFIAYLAAFFILEPAPRRSADNTACLARGSRSRFNDRWDEVKQTFHQDVKSSTHTVTELERQFNALRARVETIEAYVTSGRYQLDREFKSMSGQ
jgi:phage shock protein C